MKKVMIVLSQLWTGGIQKMNVELAAHIHDPRVEVLILSLYPNSGSLIDEQAERYGVKVRYLNKKPGIDLGMIGSIYRAMKEFRPDVVHVNQRMTTYALLPMLLLGIKKKIYVVHNLADKDAKGLARKVNRFAFHHCGMIPVAISATCRKSVSSVYGLPEEKIPCIYNGVDNDRFKRTEPYEQTDGHPVVFTTACAFREVKNLPMMVEAFARAKRKVPDIRLRLLGDGEMMPAVKSKIAELHVEESVELMGGRDDIPDWLRKADVYVLSSDWEGLPVSILEAMSAALPIIATKAGGVIDVVEDGKNGILVDVKDTERMADAMIRLASDRQLRNAFSKESERLSGQYSMEKCVEEYIRLYTEE